MNSFANLSTDPSIAQEKDVIGGGGVVDSDTYKSTVTLAYLEKSKGGALGVNLRLKTESGREIRQVTWVTSGDKKGNVNYYEKDGEKHYLPGFLLMNSLCLLTCGKELQEVAQAAENKLVKVYNYETKTEVPTEVPVLVDLLNKEIIAGVIKQIVDKNVKTDDGAYVPSGETREENEIDKFFRARDEMTTAEILAKAEKASFIHTWREKWKGQVRDKSTKGAGVAGAPVAAAAQVTKKPTASIFA